MQGKKLIVSEDQRQEIINLYAQGFNREQVAEKAGVTDWAVRKCLKGNFRKPIEWQHFVNDSREEHLTQSQQQCMFGTLLGDASISFRRGLFEYQVSHCLEQKEYCEHIATVLNRQVNEYVKDDNSHSAGKLYYRVNFSNKNTLQKIAEIVCVDNKKVVTENWANVLGPESIAYWFMDDGSSTFSKRNQIKTKFATLSFSTSELELLTSVLNKFGVKSGIAKHSKKLKTYEQQYTIEIRQQSVNDFFDMIEPYIIPCMMYKVKRKQFNV